MAKRDLTKEQLSESYSIATVRMHNLVTEFYEGLHEADGSPCIHPGLVSNMISVVRTLINHELDLIKEASLQHFEANYDQSEQAEILFSDGEGS